MLLNLSNHPSSEWASFQLQEARRLFGTVKDMPFPAIDPGANEEKLQGLAMEMAHQLINAYKHHPFTVHLMGEWNFTFLLLHHLLSNGIPCLASCSERMVEQKGEQKLITFNFRRFRYYQFPSHD